MFLFKIFEGKHGFKVYDKQSDHIFVQLLTTVFVKVAFESWAKDMKNKQIYTSLK